MKQSIIDEAERLVNAWATKITAPRAAECLACYLDRVLHDVPCDGSLRWALAYRDALAPRATGLGGRLASRGGYCDCEVLMNVYWARSDDVLPCLGARKGSTKPCALWREHRRGDRWD